MGEGLKPDQGLTTVDGNLSDGSQGAGTSLTDADRRRLDGIKARWLRFEIDFPADIDWLIEMAQKGRK